MRHDVVSAISEGGLIKRDNVLNDVVMERDLLNALRMFARYNLAVFPLVEPFVFLNPDLANAYEKLRAVSPRGETIMSDVKDMVWKLNRLWVCRECRKHGADDVDWRTITAEHCRHLPLDEYRSVREWETRFHAARSGYKPRELCRIIGCRMRKEFMRSVECEVCIREPGFMRMREEVKRWVMEATR